MATVISKQMTDLFYLGGLPENDGPQYVTAGGQAFVLPPKGESLRIELYKAEDLMRRYNIKGSLIFSLTKVQPKAEAIPQREFTRDELLAMLSKLSSQPAVQETPVDFSDEPDADIVEKATQSEVVPSGENDLSEPKPEAAPKGKGKTAKTGVDNQ